MLTKAKMRNLFACPIAGLLCQRCLTALQRSSEPCCKGRRSVAFMTNRNQFLGLPCILERASAGFTLIEVLIALVVVSVGMLGVAGLHVHGLKAGRTATYTLQAVTIAGDVADRIRANPRAGMAYAGLGADNDCIASDIDCDATEMAQQDILAWEQEGRTTLPDGNIQVEYDSGNVLPEYTIAVAWTEPGQNRRYIITIPVKEM